MVDATGLNDLLVVSAWTGHRLTLTCKRDCGHMSTILYLTLLSTQLTVAIIRHLCPKPTLT